jgi:ketosteroid isomerase-like protein
MPTKLLLGAAAAVGAQAAARRAILAKLRRDVAALNAGDAGPLLTMYADDAVLAFNEGDHRWAGEHRGKAAIARFLDRFVAAGVQGEILDVATSGPPWALRLWVRFDDRATGADGAELYRNRVAMTVDTRWGRIVRQDDFYEDTGRIETFERHLAERDRAATAV